ncbi:MAG: serine hydrolase domain-containing protein [Acidimicrobiales bacterium]
MADGFEGVRDAFVANFDNGSEVGAAFSAYHQGRKVVDLWGGVADPDTGKPWEEDTMMLVFSTTKGATAMCANPGGPARHRRPGGHLLARVRRQRQGRDARELPPVAPGRAGVVRRRERPPRRPSAGIPSSRPCRTRPRCGSPAPSTATTPPRTAGSSARSCDVAGKTVGTYFRDEISGPLDADFWIGLPEAEDHRVGKLISFIPPGITADMLKGGGDPDNPMAQMLAAFLGPDTPLGQALFAPGGALADQDVWNSRAMRAAEVPAANGVCDARSLARVYAACVGEVDGIRILTPEQLTRATTQLTTGPNHVLMDMDIQFGLGFMLPSSLIQLGGPHSFGHFGAGGSVGWADPDAELAFGYIMNRMDMGLAGDLRSANLIGACYDAI